MAGAVLIADATYRSKTVHNTRSIVDVMMSARERDETIYWSPREGDALIERSRSILATRFLLDPPFANADVLVSIDDDIRFSPTDFWKVVDACRATGQLVAGAYPTRQRMAALALRTLNGEPLDFMPGPSRLKEVQYLTTGLMAIPRRALEAMIVPGQEFIDADGTHQLHLTTVGLDQFGAYYPFYMSFQKRWHDGRIELLSEDFAISDRARQLGFLCYVDTSIILTHEGMAGFTVFDIGGVGVNPVKTGEPVIDDLPDHVGEWIEIARELVPGMIAGQGPIHALARAWNEWRAANPDAPELDWYKLPAVGDCYTMELARWHLAGGGTPAQFAESCAGKKVLSYGAGIGTFALRAARAGAAFVYAYEVNERMVGFASDRAHLYGYDHGERMSVSALKPLGLHDFDVVENWHVLEHVDPDAMLEDIRACLKPDGVLLMDCDFEKHGIDQNPMHHELSEFGYESVEELMTAHGFVSGGGRYVWSVAPVAEEVIEGAI